MKNKKPLLIISILLLTLLLSSESVFAIWRLTDEGQFVFEPEGQILGKKTTSVGSENKSDKAKDVSIKNEDKNNNSKKPTSTDEDSDTSPEASSSSARANGKLKLIKLEPNNEDKFNLKLINKYGIDLETTEGTPSGEIIIEALKYKEKIQIRVKNNAAYIIKNKIAAKPNFPLMVNPETNELMVTTPKGTKVVTILPDKAVENMLAANVLDQLGGKGGLRWLEHTATPSATPEATDSATPEPDEDATDSADLDDDDEATQSATTESQEPAQLVAEADYVIDMDVDEEGTLVYKIVGTKAKKLFGFKRIELSRTAIVSAETGELISIEQDFPTRVLDFLSITI